MLTCLGIDVTAEKLTALAAVAAAVAACLALLVTLYSVKKQVNATVISTSRREWIITLRGHLSELLAILFVASHHLQRGGSLMALQKLERFVYLESQLKLMINPNEQDHAALVELIRLAALELVQEDSGHEGRLTDLAERIIAQAQPILKREWSRVKKGA